MTLSSFWNPQTHAHVHNTETHSCKHARTFIQAQEQAVSGQNNMHAYSTEQFKNAICNSRHHLSLPLLTLSVSHSKLSVSGQQQWTAMSHCAMWSKLFHFWHTDWCLSLQMPDTHTGQALQMAERQIERVKRQKKSNWWNAKRKMLGRSNSK